MAAKSCRSATAIFQVAACVELYSSELLLYLILPYICSRDLPYTGTRYVLRSTPLFIATTLLMEIYPNSLLQCIIGVRAIAVL